MTTPLASDACELFARSVRRTPRQLAVDHESAWLTYESLDIASSSLAHRLQRKGVRLGDAVLLLTEHGTYNLVALLAILKAGACYVPMDRSSWSSERIQTVIDTVDSRFLINTTPAPFESDRHNVFHLKEDDLADLIIVDSESDGVETVGEAPQIKPDDLCCLIFTSGSTGKPKGVMIPHRAVAAYAQTSPFNMNVQAGDRVLHILSVAFDASTGMLFSILGNSGTVIPATMDNLYDKAQACTILASTPSILATLPLPSAISDSYPAVHTILLGGESPPAALLASWLDRSVRILNAYGPTETTCASLMQVVEISSKTGAINRSIIGAPMSRGPVYLLRPDLSPIEEVENGEEGEIVITGIGLANGYYMNPELTAERFITWRGTRAYRTGDQGRWIRRNDGQLVVEFRGRSDRTVKNRGFLVNLPAEVEDPLRGMGYRVTDVYSAMINGQLISLVTPETVDLDGLRREAQSRLSAFHVPDLFCAVSEFPLSANGKIDTKAIEKLLQERQALLVAGEEGSFPALSATDGEGYALEQTMAECMYKALGLDAATVSKDVNFFAMGGNSLMALRFTSLCREKGISITTRNIYLHPTLRGITEYVRSMPTSDSGSTPKESQPGESDDDEDMYRLSALRTGIAEYLHLGETLPEDIHVAPLTPLQLELSAAILASDGTNTNQFRLSYSLADGERVCDAWREVRLSEPVFRTEVTLDVASGVQIMHPKPVYTPLELVYCRREDYEAAISEPHDLSVGLGMRLTFYKYIPAGGVASEEGEVTVDWTVHHSLIDGYSLGLVLGQVQCAVAGKPLTSGSSFLDASSRLLRIQRKRDEEARNFWTQYLDPVRTVSGSKRHTQFVDSPYLAQEILFRHGDGIEPLQQLASACKVTLATVYYTAWAMALGKFYDNTTVSLGAVFSGREALPEYSDAVGPLMSVLPLVYQFDSEASVEQRLQSAMEGIASISAYAWCAPEQVGHRVQSLVATQYDFPAYEEAIGPVKERFFENTTFPLSLLIEEDARFRLVYNPAAHSAQTAQELARLFLSALAALVQAESTKTGSENMPRQDAVKHEDESNLASAVYASVDSHADLVAVESPDGELLSYAELDRRSNIVARHIADHVPNAQVIAIHADGSLNWIVGILAILKSGCAYCPLDPVYPLARKISVYSRSGADALLIPNAETCSSARLELPDSAVLVVDELLSETTSGDGERRRSLLDNANEDALIVYTSGTTGVPKGVPISHKGLLALQSNPEATMFSRPGRRIAQFMSPAFDYCANEIFSALLHGGTLVLRDPLSPLSSLSKADVATITPSVLCALEPADYPNLIMVYATGEPVTPGLLDRWARDREFYNAYGPAECSICTSFTRLVPGQTVTIGRAIPTARMYILTPELQPVADGQSGEIVLAGKQVMRGYLGDEEKTACRVVPDPWHPGERMYRTGDYGYWSEDQEIVYIGRTDRQVKVRGYRVELAAVEQRMYQEEPMLTQAATLVVNDTLVAFVMPRTIDVGRLEKRLREALQPSWVPQVITALESFPWTVNRKVDFKKLEEMATLAPREVQRESGAFGSECVVDQVAKIWKEVLRLDDCAVLEKQADFSSLGGHSILQIMLASRLGRHFGISVSIRDVIQHPTLGDQAELVRCRGKKSISAQQNANIEALSDHHLSPLERQTWFQYLVASDVRAFNIPVLLQLEGSFDRARLVRSINAALAYRKAFRANFIETADGPHRIFRKEPPQVRVCEKLNTSEEINRGFELARQELMRVFLHRNTLLIVTSHAVADLNSVQNLLREASAVYSGSRLPTGERWNYTQATTWSRATAPEDRQFWTEYLAGAPQRLHIPRQPGRMTFEGTSHVSHFHGPAITRLLALGKQHSMTQHQLVCAAVAQTLQWLAGTNDVVLGSPWANRTQELEQSSVGLFLDRLPLRIQTPADADCSTILRSTRESSQKAVCHAAPFEQILDILRLQRTIQQHPIFEAMVTFHLKGAVEECLSLDGITTRREMCYASGAKFLLMFEWTEIDADHWVLRIEYDHNQLEHWTIAIIDESLRFVLDGLADGLSRPAIQAQLGQINAPAVQKPPSEGIVSELYSRLVSILSREMATCLDVPVNDFPCTASFFDIGGNSIHVWRLQRQLKRVGLNVDIGSVFEHPTAQQLAEHVSRRIF